MEGKLGLDQRVFVEPQEPPSPSEEINHYNANCCLTCIIKTQVLSNFQLLIRLFISSPSQGQGV